MVRKKTPKKRTGARAGRKTVAKTARRPGKAPRSGEIRAESVMSRNVVTVREDLPIAGLIREIRARTFNGFPVVDGEERAVGLVSQGDVLRALAFAVGAEPPPQDGSLRRKASAQLLEMTAAAAGGAVSELLARPVRDVMTREVASCRPETKLADVCRAMVARRIHRVVVLDRDRRVRGLICATDLVKRLGQQLRAR